VIHFHILDELTFKPSRSFVTPNIFNSSSLIPFSSNKYSSFSARSSLTVQATTIASDIEYSSVKTKPKKPSSEIQQLPNSFHIQSISFPLLLLNFSFGLLAPAQSTSSQTYFLLILCSAPLLLSLLWFGRQLVYGVPGVRIDKFLDARENATRAFSLVGAF
jgi:hypothetical protein